MGYLSVIFRRNGRTVKTDYFDKGESFLIPGVLQITHKNKEITIKNLQNRRRRFLVDLEGNCKYDGQEIVPLYCKINQRKSKIKNRAYLKCNRLNIIDIYNEEIWLI